MLNHCKNQERILVFADRALPRAISPTGRGHTMVRIRGLIAGVVASTAIH